MPEPVAFYPLNVRYKAAEKENRQPKGILKDVAITNGPYNEPGGAYMFYGTDNSFIDFPKLSAGSDAQSSITLMCWVQPEGQDGPLFGGYRRTIMGILNGKFFVQLHTSSPPLTAGNPATGKWVHVAASYDNNTKNNSLYLNGHLRASQNVSSGYRTLLPNWRYRMGSAIYGRYQFKGKIAEMKVYDVALNEAQIQTSIRQGSCTFPIIFVSLPSPMIPLIIETHFYWKALQEVADNKTKQHQNNISLDDKKNYK